MLKHLLCILLLANTAILVSQNPWTDLPEQNIPARAGAHREIVPRQYRTVRLDLSQLRPLLAAAPERFSPAAAEGEVVLVLPLPDDSWGRFRLTESPLMAPALQAKYPDIRCYTGRGIDDPSATLKCDLTPQGFHASIHSAKHGPVFIDPYRRGDSEHCIVYHKKELPAPKIPFSCDAEMEAPGPSNHSGSPEAQGDCIFRRYRLALACTGEYAAFHGGTKALALAAMATTMNRVNGIYERDFAITMQLIANNDTLVFTDPATDGYSNGNTGMMITQNQTKCNNLVGAANYDIGHVFGIGGGGIAGLGVVCGNSVKARGVTSLNQPIGDPFDVDYVAHEMGHQFGANHCFNSSCSGNRNADTAFEPGSGTSIMAYAGVCSPYNIQAHSDDFFHAVSLQEIGNYVTNSQGGVCALELNTGNDAPTVSAGGNYTIPKSTPFALTAAGNDLNGDSLSYCWEQMDKEVATMPPLSTSTSGPLFRSFPPEPSPTRYFPRLAELVNNSDPIWEKLPGVARTMKFRVSVRDNFPGGGCTSEADAQLSVSGSAGPFLVTTPNTALSWFVGDTETVSWDVANTNLAPVACAQVRILLSTDGGFTYPFVLANAVPNTGSATVLVPNQVSANCRVMVRALGNVFFDISNQNFNIEIPPVPTFLLSFSANGTEQACVGDTLEFTADISPISGFSDPVNLSLDGAPANASITIDPNPLAPGNSALVTITNLDMPGVHTLTLSATSGAIVRTQMFELSVVDGAPEAPVLSSPADGALNQSLAPPLHWVAVPNALQYRVQAATNPSFEAGTLVFDQTTTGTSAVAGGLDTSTVYYWRVKVFNACGESDFGETFAFQTGRYDCGYLYNSPNVPVLILDAGTVSSTLDVPDNRHIADVDLFLKVDHSWVGDLEARLVSPASDTAVLFDQPGFPALSSGCNGINLDLHFDDEAVQTAADLENTCDTMPAIVGAFQPIELLNRYDNAAAMGSWRLSMTDNFSSDGGAITAWSLAFCFYDTVPPAELLQNKTLTVLSGASGTITDDHLQIGIASNAPGDGIFTLLSLPQHGDITLNGLPLGVGGAFSQADILAGSVQYAHNGDAALSDAFLFDALDASSGGWIHAVQFDIAILQNDLLVSAEITQALLCHNDSTAQIEVTVSGGTPPFGYSLNGGAAQMSELFSGLPAGAYTVVVTDQNGFTAETNSLSIANPPALEVNAQVTYDDITVQVVNGAPPLEYSLDGQNFQSDNIFKNLPNGNYAITVRDAKGCTATATATVEVPPLLILSLTAEGSIPCFGGTISLLVSAGGGIPPYEYSLNGSPYQTDSLFKNVGAGMYTISVRDAAGKVVQSQAITVAEPAPLGAVFQVTGNDLTVQGQGGTPPYRYALDNGFPKPGGQFLNLANGPHELVVIDSNGCVFFEHFVLDYPALSIQVSASDPLCAGDENGSIVLALSGGTPPYSCSMNGDSCVLNGLPAGVYHFVITDFLGDTAQTTVTLVDPPALAASAAVSGDTITVTAAGGTGALAYSIDGLNYQSSPVFADLPNATYTVRVRDENACITVVENVVVNFVGTVSPADEWGLTVQPNPGDGRFLLYFRQAPAGPLRADVFDTTGRLLHQRRLEPTAAEFSLELDLTDLPSGVYWLRLTSGSAAGALRLVVQ